MKLFKLTAIVILVLSLTGCTDRSDYSQEQLIDSLELPPHAENIKMLNPPIGSWHTFEITIDGVKHKILRHHTGGESATESSILLPSR